MRLRDRGLPIEQLPGHRDFRHLSGISGITLDLRYATPHNFVGRDLYWPHDCAWLHRDASAALEKSIAWLARERPACSILVLDALRPQRVQEQLWESLGGTDLRSYLAPPERGSIHSFGMALDLTLLGPDGAELDMGTRFDDLSEVSQPVLEEQLLADARLSPLQVANRRLLRAAMQHGGWRGINSEWWHFDCGDRDLVRAGYIRVL